MIILGIGSNLPSKYGDRFTNINLAMSYLESYGILILKKSSFYETLSYPNKKDPKFINIAVSVKTNLNPIDLMSILIFIEEKLERKRLYKNSPRTCDIDIIDYLGKVESFSYDKHSLFLPHEKASERNFVLFPLKEIYPGWIHPKNKNKINDLIDKLPNEDKKSIFKIERD